MAELPDYMMVSHISPWLEDMGSTHYNPYFQLTRDDIRMEKNRILALPYKPVQDAQSESWRAMAAHRRTAALAHTNASKTKAGGIGTVFKYDLTEGVAATKALGVGFLAMDVDF